MCGLQMSIKLYHLETNTFSRSRQKEKTPGYKRNNEHYGYLCNQPITDVLITNQLDILTNQPITDSYKPANHRHSNTHPIADILINQPITEILTTSQSQTFLQISPSDYSVLRVSECLKPQQKMRHLLCLSSLTIVHSLLYGRYEISSYVDIQYLSL
jgi:hypothetical protein